MKKLLLILLTLVSFSAFSQTRVPYSYSVDTFTVNYVALDTIWNPGHDTVRSIILPDTFVLLGSKVQGTIPITSYLVNTNGTVTSVSSTNSVSFTPDTVVYNKIIDCANLYLSGFTSNIYPVLHYSSDMALHSYAGTIKGIKLEVHKIGSAKPSFYVLYGAR
jgi:hypothetical protein